MEDINRDPPAPEPDPRDLALERRWLELERERIQFERGKKSPSSSVPAVAAIVSAAAVLLSGINGSLANRQSDRDFRLKAVSFVMENGDRLFNPDTVQLARNKAILSLFPREFRNIIVKNIQRAAPDTASVRVWSDLERQIRFQTMLESYRAQPGPRATVEEATSILKYLGATPGSAKGPDYVSGLLPDTTEVTVWAGTYGKPSCYGIRFGSPDHSYFASNRTYFEYCK